MIFSKDLYFFTLTRDIKKAQTSTKDRELAQWQINWIQYHHDIGIATPRFGTIIDNTLQTPEKTAEKILSDLQIKLNGLN